MKLYKLTDKNGKTRNNTKWCEGVTHKAKPGKGKLCSEYYIHAYTHPLLAVFLNPIHADIKDYRLWEAKGRIAKTDYGLKVGCKSLTTIKEIEPPEVTLVNKIAFGILCALEVNEDPEYKQWAENWLSGKDRSGTTAEAAWKAAAAQAAWAAWAAEKPPLDLIKLAEKAMEVK